MRNLKKFLALVLAMMMMLSVAVISTGAASDDADYTEAAQRLAALQVMKGNENGDLMLGNGVTRYQAALFFVQALTGETDAAVWNAEKKSAHFADVPEYGTAIDYAYGINLIKGRGNGVYGYNDAISYQDMLVMAVRALGYETADMSYPYGYILAAQKLGLTENVDLVNYKAALNRGETAQIIWDMLDTEVAAIDPLTDKVLYPGEQGLTDALLGKDGKPVVKRETLMTNSDLAGDKIVATLAAIDVENEGEEDEFFFVNATYTYTEVVNEVEVETEETVKIAAADLGITEDTAKVTYVGLPVEMYISVDVADFAEKYEMEEPEAEVVFVVAPTYTTVANFGDGNIKYVAHESNEDKDYFSFAGTKFTMGGYTVEVKEFVDGAWTDSDKDLAEIFAYEDDAYAEGQNTFGQVAYRVNDEVVEVLYTAYEFGQYNVREIADVEYPVIVRYEGSAFVERLAGADDNMIVDDDTKKVTNKKAEPVLAMTMAGEEVKAGEFMFYSYNEEDNVLTVAKTYGDFETGRLTAKSTAKKTVKIDGTNYEFGFDGFAPAFASAWEDYADSIQTWIGNLEPGMDNVEYLVVNGKIVYIAACDDDTTSANEESIFDFAFVSTEPELLQELLGYSDNKFENAFTADIIVNEDGYMTIAVLNLETGKWELASLKAVVFGWDGEEFAKSVDPAVCASYVDIVGDTYAKYGDYTDALEVLEDCFVAAVEVKDGVYTIAAQGYEYIENEGEDDEETITGTFSVGADTTEGLVFFDNNTKTNKITADASEDAVAERVTLDDESVIVFFDGTTAGARVGAQAAADSQAVAGTFYAASSKLIVFVSANFTIDVAEDWHEGSATRELDEVYYITTVDTAAELENVRTEDDEEASYLVTLTNLYNLNTNEMVEYVQVVVEDANDALVSLEGAGTLLVAEGEDLAVADITFAEAVLAIANANEDEIDYVAVEDVNFVADDEIVIAEITGEGKMTAGEAVTVEATVITINNIADDEELDFDFVVLNKEYVEDEDYFDATDVEFVDEVVYFSFELDLDDAIAEIDEPTAGVFDNYALEAETYGVLVANADEEVVEVTVDFEILAAYDEGVVYLTVYRTIALAD